MVDQRLKTNPFITREVSQQKIVIRVSAVDHKKGRSKALEIAASISGVESIALLGEENDEIEVIGDEVDVVGLARTLRKKIGHAEVLKVGPADQKKESTNTSTLPSLHGRFQRRIDDDGWFDSHSPIPE
ncbi:hypothetical protein LguiB_029921 [Lonicera macranthoides]